MYDLQIRTQVIYNCTHKIHENINYAKENIDIVIIIITVNQTKSQTNKSQTNKPENIPTAKPQPLTHLIYSPSL